VARQRYCWCQLVSPDGRVTLIGEEGDPDPIAAETPAALPE
jgi:hypothetical protein